MRRRLIKLHKEIEMYLILTQSAFNPEAKQIIGFDMETDCGVKIMSWFSGSNPAAKGDSTNLLKSEEMKWTEI